MKILLADDHSVVRQGLKQILADAMPTARFGEAATAAAALELVWNQEWDVVITDITMPGRSGLDLLKELKAAKPQLPVLVLSMHPEDQYARRVLQAGADGYLTKDSADAQLVAAVQKVLSGGKYVSPALAEKLAAEVALGRQQSPHEALSDREYEVLRLLAAGKTVKEIGAELRLSVQTISTYRARLLEKLRVKTNADLVAYARAHGLAE
jgi:two-component system, NarL family, invasion response regulator UvrY